MLYSSSVHCKDRRYGTQWARSTVGTGSMVSVKSGEIDERFWADQHNVFAGN